MPNRAFDSSSCKICAVTCLEEPTLEVISQLQRRLYYIQVGAISDLYIIVILPHYADITSFVRQVRDEPELADLLRAGRLTRTACFMPRTPSGAVPEMPAQRRRRPPR